MATTQNFMTPMITPIFEPILQPTIGVGAADDEFSPYVILDENLNAIHDLLGNVIEEEY